MLPGTGKTETTGHTRDKGGVSSPRYHLNEHRDSTEKVELCFLEKKKYNFGIWKTFVISR